MLEKRAEMELVFFLFSIKFSISFRLEGQVARFAPAIALRRAYQPDILLHIAEKSLFLFFLISILSEVLTKAFST